MSIKEYSMDSGTVQSYQQNQDIVPNCSLASWYAPTTQQRWVVYQEINNGNLKVLNVNTKQGQYLCWVASVTIIVLYKHRTESGTDSKSSARS